ncbi:unnamed protein product [Rhizophagus irregularis]|nr:unnamed protein product [Rhizophagus irregularis]
MGKEISNSLSPTAYYKRKGKNYTYNRLPNHFYYNARSITRELQKGFIYHNRKRIFVGARCFLQLKRISLRALNSLRSLWMVLSRYLESVNNLIEDGTVYRVERCVTY